MQTYARKTDIFHAIQYTGDNREKIIDALGIPKEDCECWTNQDTKENYLIIKSVPELIYTKWWLLIASSGKCDAVSAELFESTYRQIWIKG